MDSFAKKISKGHGKELSNWPEKVKERDVKKECQLALKYRRVDKCIPGLADFREGGNFLSFRDPEQHFPVRLEKDIHRQGKGRLWADASI